MHEVAQPGEHYRESESIKEGVNDHGTIFWGEGTAPSAKKEREPRRVRQLDEMVGPSSKPQYTQLNSFLHGIEVPVGIIQHGFGAARR